MDLVKQAASMLRAFASQPGSTIESLSRFTGFATNAFQRFQPQLVSEQEQSLLCRLPPELLQAIFVQTLLPQSYGKGFSMSVTQLPWELSQVCRLWRNIALSTPELWRQLPTIRLEGSKSKRKSYLKFLIEILKRSGGMSLDIHIDGRVCSRYPHPAVDILTPHSNRFRKLKIDATHDILPSLNKIKGQFSSLQRLVLVLCFDPYPISDADNLTFDLFEIAPKLDDVFLAGPTGNFIFPSNQLVRYSQRAVPKSQVFNIIHPSGSSLLNLRTLELGELPKDDVLSDIILPSLISLTVHFLPDIAAPEWLLDRLTLPAVESLTITSYRSGGDLFGSVQSMILRSGSPSFLKTFNIHSELVSSGRLANLLKCTPFLESLGATLPSPSVISALACNPAGPPLVPLLRNCTFTIKEPMSEEATSALNLLGASRCELGEWNHKVRAETLVLSETVIRPLDSLRLVIHNGSPKDCQRDLEGWTETEISQKLRERKNLLFNALPGFVYYRIPQTEMIDSQSQERACSILNDIETIEIEDVRDISLAWIYESIYGITVKEGDGVDPFRQTARRILDKWDSVLEETFKDVRWVVSSLTLSYLSQSHRLRSSEKAANVLFRNDNYFRQ
ncbi:hypothetical protein GALMADRAFT_160269 [Galerina marginata CBS 339.88]|uniref:F-box domain-containing protein n=1 Tax=Galerina marginata (strain CBS 339.88) TaxID=685588 RepID=A0A067SFQ8_GALM3|nr:hypothetical protein GALMADRAFT_160269 [Galerina marginata CBS 339.88]